MMTDITFVPERFDSPLLVFRRLPKQLQKQLQKVSVGFVMSDRLSIRMELLDGFFAKFYTGRFLGKLSRRVKFG
jgi:cell division septal protein FtsQ